MRDRNNSKVGDKVTCNGYPGTVTEVCNGVMTGMVVVRLDAGAVCAADCAPEVIPAERDALQPGTAT